MTETRLDQLWRQRHQPAVLQTLRDELESLLGAPESPGQYDSLWRWACLQHFLGMQSGDDHARTLAFYETGCSAAQRAVVLDPFGVEGHFWYGVNLIKAARLHNPLAAVKALRAANKHIERARDIDEGYHSAGPLRVWGRMTHQKPLLLGGSLDRALDIYRRALQIAPRNSTNLLYYAEALLADRQPSEARAALKQLLAAPDDPDWVWEQQRDRQLAANLLQTF